MPEKPRRFSQNQKCYIREMVGRGGLEPTDLTLIKRVLYRRATGPPVFRLGRGREHGHWRHGQKPYGTCPREPNADWRSRVNKSLRVGGLILSVVLFALVIAMGSLFGPEVHAGWWGAFAISLVFLSLMAVLAVRGSSTDG